MRAFYLGNYGNRSTTTPKVEVFGESGFLTLTGNRMNGDGIIPLPAQVKDSLDALFAGQPTKSTRSDQMSKVKASDPIYQRLVKSGLILKEYHDGKVGITCPFASEHKSGSGESSTVYFLPYTNGYDHGTFVCKHVHCSGRTQSDFLKAIGPTCESPPAADAETDVNPMEGAILSAKEFSEIIVLPRPYYIDPIVWSQSYHLYSGPEGIGKTLFCQTMALALSTGKDFGPWETLHAVNVLYLDGELVVGDLQERFHGLDPDYQNNPNLKIYSNMRAIENGLRSAILYDDAWREDMLKLCIKLRIRVIFLDNIFSLSDSTDINKLELWAPVNSWCLRLRSNDTTPILLHHTGKSGDQLGTKGREINVDMSARFLYPPGCDGSRGAEFILKYKKHRLPHDKLKMVRPLHMHLTRISGRDVWDYQSPTDAIRMDVLDLLVKGSSIREVAKDLGVSKSTVSRIRTKAFDEKLIWENDKGECGYQEKGISERERWLEDDGD